MPDTRTLLIAAAALGGLYLLSQAQAKPAPPATAPPAKPPPPPPAQPTPPSPSPIPVKQKWTQLLGIDPDIIMQKGTKISEQEWLNTEAKHYGIDPSRFVRFTGSNGTVAYGYAPGGQPKKTGEDPLGHPLLTSSTGGPIYIISWSPYMYRYNNIVYDLLAYVIESRK